MALSTTAKVGILTIVALIALGLVTVWKTDLFMVREGYDMIGEFVSVEGLTVGSEVRYRGLKVGKVLRIDPGPLDIKVYSVIDKKIKFPADSYLRVAYDGIVGQKYLEIAPGTSEVAYLPSTLLPSIKTSAIVDFVDIGAQNLQESKKILEDFRLMIEDPKIREAIYGTVYAANNVAVEAEKLTSELRDTNQGIRDIVADPKFQENMKGTIAETNRTLTSANNFFDSVSKMNVRASGGIDVGSRANAVKGNVDIIRDENNYFRFGMGEGPTRQISLLDMLFTSRVNKDFGFRLGVINNQLGGGVAFYPGPKSAVSGDIYDINNEDSSGATTARLWPRIRLGWEYEVRDYMDVSLKGDDLLNNGNRNVTFGILVKPPGESVY
ncbi:MAG: MCE family protein [Candidatus Margulisbacteria bacterium]|nr:MCE family protein [Candidatus Margulisiibacteriota bacterium]